MLAANSSRSSCSVPCAPSSQCSFSGRTVRAFPAQTGGRPGSRRLVVQAVGCHHDLGAANELQAARRPCIAFSSFNGVYTYIWHAPGASAALELRMVPCCCAWCCCCCAWAAAACCLLLACCLPAAAQAVASAQEAMEGGGPPARPRHTPVQRAHRVPGQWPTAAGGCSSCSSWQTMQLGRVLYGTS